MGAKLVFSRDTRLDGLSTIQTSSADMPVRSGDLSHSANRPGSFSASNFRSAAA